MGYYKKWLIVTFSTICCCLFIVGSVNAYIDPLWLFSHSNRFNSIQIPVDERQQKINAFRYNKKNYDTLIIGSSRTSYINHEDFKGFDAFNLSLPSLRLENIGDYIEYAKERNKKDFQYIIIGLDFFATNKNEVNNFPNPEYYFNKKNSFYRLKVLLSKDTIDYSLRNFKSSMTKKLANGHRAYYNRNNVKFTKKSDGEEKVNLIKNQIRSFRSNRYGESYEYGNVKELLNEIKNKNSNSKIIVFTTPVSQPLLELLIKEGRVDDYKNWIRDIVSVYGRVYNFMYINAVTKDDNNFYDSHHFYPEIGTCIVHKIIGFDNICINSDFGILVTEEKLKEHLEFIEENLKE